MCQEKGIASYFLQFEPGVYEKTKPNQDHHFEESKHHRPDQEMIFVEKLQKIKDKAVLIWLSNGSVQVNFPESCILI